MKRILPVALSLTLVACTRKNPEVEQTPKEPVPNPRTDIQSALPAGPPPALDELLASVAERAAPSVVSVSSTRAARADTPELPLDNPFFRRFFGPEGPSPFPSPRGGAPELRGLGSGVMVGKDLVLTNAHVVEGADRLEITVRDRRTVDAEVVGSDPKSDLAVLRLKGETGTLPALEFADSSRARLGQVVLAIGNPFGVGQTVTMGIVSATGRANLGIVDYEDFIQTDAAINPGNSGGALVDLNGRLLGIPTAILSRTGGYMGVGFAIPSNMARPIMDSLLRTGRVTRGFLGVSIQEVDQDIAKALGLASNEGVLVSDVSSGGPAAKAGLKRGDVIRSLDGKPVRSSGELRNLIASSPVGRTVRVEVTRGKETRAIDVKLEQMPSSQAEPAKRPEAAQATTAGLSVVPLDATLRKRLNVPPEEKHGVAVTAVDPGSPAARAGIRPGDVILEFDRRLVESPERLRQAWSKAQGPTAVLIVRDGRTVYVTLER